MSRRYTLEERLQDKKADPTILIEAMETMADLNFEALHQTVGLTDFIYQTLAKGAPYPSNKPDLLDRYGHLHQTVLDFADHVAHISDFPGERKEKHIQRLNSIGAKVRPALNTLHSLFKQGYHRPSPIPADEQEAINVITSLQRFPGLFAEPVTTAARILSWRSKLDVTLKNAHNMEELIRVIHGTGLDRIEYILSDIYFEKQWYAHLKTIPLDTESFILKVRGLGSRNKKEFYQSPVWPIVQAMDAYSIQQQTTHNRLLYRGQVLTTTLSFISELIMIRGDKVRGAFKVHYDQKEENYRLEYICSTKGHFGTDFKKGVADTFRGMGYRAKGSNWNGKAFWVGTRVKGTSYAVDETRKIFDAVHHHLTTKRHGM